jgi:hypothetical protein
MKSAIVEQLAIRFGKPRKLDRSQSIFQFGGDKLLVYFRYSKKHARNTLFYGLRTEDLRRLEGRPSVICFLWEDQNEPVFLPFVEYEELFRSSRAARDGQFKVHIILRTQGADLSLPKVGRFAIDGYAGWESLERRFKTDDEQSPPTFSHSQVQSLLGAIGLAKDFDVWMPLADRDRVRRASSLKGPLIKNFPSGYNSIQDIVSQVDVIWIERGSSVLSALFEIEHSTTIYSGLLRFNDVRLLCPRLEPSFSIVADDERRTRFVRQLNRPTFQRSGLSDVCSFMKYEEVFYWHRQIVAKTTPLVR